MEKTLFKSKEKKTAREAAAVLREIADKMESGEISLKREGEDFVLKIPADLVFEMKVEEESKDNQLEKKFEIEIEWVEEGSQTSETTTAD